MTPEERQQVLREAIEKINRKADEWTPHCSERYIRGVRAAALILDETPLNLTMTAIEIEGNA